jgi:hypothetical protein
LRLLKGECLQRYHALSWYQEVWWVVLQIFCSKFQLERE